MHDILAKYILVCIQISHFTFLAVRPSMNVGVIPKKVNIGNLNNMHAKKRFLGKKILKHQRNVRGLDNMETIELKNRDEKYI